MTDFESGSLPPAGTTWHHRLRLSDIPIRTKLLCLMALTALLALALSISGVIINEKIMAGRVVTAELRSMADVLALNSTAALAFEEKQAAESVLSSLQAFDDVEAGFLYDRKGELFSSYLRPVINSGADVEPVDSFEKEDVLTDVLRGLSVKPQLIDSRLHIVRPVRLDGEIIGGVHLVDDQRRFKRRLSRFYTMMVSIFVVSLVLISLLATRLQRIFTQPLDRIIATMDTVRSEKDYSVQIEDLGRDEFGILAKRFNEMFHQIRSRDLELEEHNSRLEETVASRTKKLRISNEELATTVEYLEKTKVELEQATKAERIFLANMSHEIRTPMNSIIGRTSLALENKLDEETRSHLEMISSSSENLLALLNDILDFSKMEAGGLNIEQRPFNLHATVKSCLKSVYVIKEDKDRGLNLTYTISPDVPHAVSGDDVRLRQILLNLLSNSVKFTEKGSIELSVDCLGADDKSVELQFKVQDTGIGIALDKQKQIFEKFSQEDDSITRKFGGTGLGLAICLELSRLMGGNLEVVSVPGEGSTFTLTLSFQKCSIRDIPLKEKVPEEKQFQAPPLSLLVVEDNEPNRVLAKMVLERMNHKTTMANDGLQALEALIESDFDAVLMDVQMPVIDGLHASRIIRAAENGKPVEGVKESLAKELTGRLCGGHIPIIAMTANAMAGDREECLAAGMDEYLSKPFNTVFLAVLFHRIATDQPLTGRGEESSVNSDISDRRGEKGDRRRNNRDRRRNRVDRRSSATDRREA